MSSTVKAALILSTAAMLAAFLLGGIYTATPGGGGSFALVVNRWTGSAQACGGGACWKLERKDIAPPTSAATWGQGDPIVTGSGEP